MLWQMAVVLIILWMLGLVTSFTTGNFVSYRLSSRWLMRGTWDRIIADYDRDTDMFLGGIGYRF